MNRNEYRRAFIMLRAVLQGYGGHVRLEQRTLSGSMYFIVTAPQGAGELAVALAGQQNGAYYAAPVGRLARDRRGQLALAWPFDPRSIGGRPLEAYAWVVIADTGRGCAVALTGNVDGARPMDRLALQGAVRDLFREPDEPAADLPEADASPVADASPEAGIPTEADALPDVPRDDASAAIPAQPSADPDDTDGDVRIYLSSRSRLRARRKAADSGEAPQAAAPDSEGVALPAPDALTGNPLPTPDAPVSIPSTDPDQSSGVPSPAPDEPTANPSPAPEATAAPPETAAKRLGLDITVPWPGFAEPLRRLFATQPPADPAPDDGYTYVRVPMPEGSGYGEGLSGLCVRDGAIIGVRHALPARQTPEPPPGLENHAWLPGAAGMGYWVVDEE